MTGYALFVGVNELSEHYVKSNEFELDVDQNIKSITQILKTNNPEIKVSNIKRPINLWSEFTSAIDPFKKPPREETFLLIYICCHSAIVKHLTTMQELNFLCFTEQMIYVNEWKRQLAQIHENYNVVVILDTCYGENFTDQKQAPDKPFQKTFEHYYNSFYKDQIEQQDCLLTSANFCFLTSTDRNSVTSPYHFSKTLENLSLFERQLSNLDFFEQILKVTISPKPTLNIPWHSRNDFFNKNTLFGKPLKITSKIKVDFTSSIEIDERGNKTALGIRVLQPHVFYYSDTLHWHVKDDTADLNFIALRDKIINTLGTSVLQDIELIGVVTVNIDHVTGDPLPIQSDNSSFIPIRGLKSLGCNGKDCSSVADCEPDKICYESNCLIVLIASDNKNALVGHKRTKGKVTNKLG